MGLVLKKAGSPVKVSSIRASTHSQIHLSQSVISEQLKLVSKSISMSIFT